MKKKLLYIILLVIVPLCIQAQVITTSPTAATDDQALEIILDATGTALASYTGDVYAHTGVITNKSASTSDWKYAPSGWGDNSLKYKLTSMGDNKWKYTISPDVRSFYGVPAGEKILKLAFVFRSKDGSLKHGADSFIPVYDKGLVVTTTTNFITANQKDAAIIFNAALCTGGLNNYAGTDIYAHTGVITDKSTSDADWKYAPAWSGTTPDAKYKLTSLGNNKWMLTFTPDIRTFYGVPADEKILKIALLFRNSNGSVQGKAEDKDILISVSETGALVESQPGFLREDKSAKIILNVPPFAEGGLTGYTGDVYAHTGVITDKSISESDWKYTSKWGDNSDQYKMIKLEDNKYELDVTPDIRAFYGVPDGEKILKLAFVFRSTDGSKQLKDGSKDILLPVYDSELAVRFTTPTGSLLLDKNGTIDINAESSISTDLKLLIDEKAIESVSSATSISHSFQFENPGMYWLIVEAGTAPNSVRDSIYVNVKKDIESTARPIDTKVGVNLIDDNTATFVLYAPKKSDVYLIGDFNDWKADNSYMLNKDGDYWWITLKNLEKGKEYGFQYLVDGTIRIADPYTDKVLDPWNDPYIPASVYPDLKKYPTGKTTGIASVVQTGQTPYAWKTEKFKTPAKEKMVIYELHIRDFTEEHSFESTAKKLDYLQKLGVNVVELMPVNEFEGNNSWGYNPSFYFAVDKYYGTKDAFKAFVDECHQRGMAVVLDMVLNHSFSQSPFVQLYFDNKTGLVTPNNPWYNVESPNTAYSWGYDFNHESDQTKALVDSINSYWINEYKVDGFRFDFTKGFTNTPGDGWAYDQARVDILKRMASEIHKRKSDALVIFEHLADNWEEMELSKNNIMLWGNMNNTGTGNYLEAIMGYTDNNKTDLSMGLYTKRGWSAPNLVAYMESHDEERLMYKAITYGKVKDLPGALKRAELVTAFYLPLPGPKMIWQFGELGYDYSIDACSDGEIGKDGSCRTAEKPIRWDYLEDANRKQLYDVYAKLAQLKKEEPIFSSTSIDYSLNGGQKHFIWKGESEHAFLIGNFDATAATVSLTLPKTGSWKEVFSNETINTTSTDYNVKLEGGEYKLYISAVPTAIEGEDSFNNVRIIAHKDRISITPNRECLVELYDIRGVRLGFEKTSNEYTVEGLAQGVYILRIDGQTRKVKL